MPKVYIACEEMDFTWTQDQLRDFNRMWKQGLSHIEIAEHLNRDPYEVILLVLDYIRINRIKDCIRVDIHDKSAPKTSLLDRIDSDLLHELYSDNSLSLEDVAKKLSVSFSTIQKKVTMERKKNPEKWPLRYKGRGVKR